MDKKSPLLETISILDYGPPDEELEAAWQDYIRGFEETFKDSTES